MVRFMSEKNSEGRLKDIWKQKSLKAEVITSHCKKWPGRVLTVRTERRPGTDNVDFYLSSVLLGNSEG